MPETDVNQLMRRNLADVFSQRDPQLRISAIAALYTDEPTLYEPANVVRGRQAISDTVGRLLESLPADFAFRPAGPAIGHHGVCCVQWEGGPAENPAALSGSDVAILSGDRIDALYVFIRPTDA